MQDVLSGIEGAMDLTVNCKVYNAKLTEEGCLRNRQRAVACGLRLRNSEPGAVLVINETDLDRLAGCSQCKLCEIEGLQDTFINAVTRDITILVDQILDEPLRSFDPAEQREKELAKYRRYNSKR